MKAFTLLALGAVAGASTVAWADYFEDFDTDVSANWLVLTSDGQPDHEATFSYDYFNTLRIPSAPNSVGGTTKGLVFRTNLVSNVDTTSVCGLSTSAIGKKFTTDFVFTADVWLNYLGPGPGGGSGTTQLAAIGWGTNVGTPEAPGFAQTNSNNLTTRDSIFMATTLDGGSAVDWRIYAKDSRFTVANGYYYGAANSGNNVVPGVYPSGDVGANLNSSNAYWTTNFPTQPLLADQAIPFPTQTGSTNTGSVGFKWREWKVTKTGDILTFHIDNILIGTVDLTFCTVSSMPNILLAMMDSNYLAAVDPNGLNAMIVDNVRVIGGDEGQSVTGNLNLASTAASFAVPRNISYEVMQGTLVVASGSVIANSPDTAFEITMPEDVTGAATIVWDGSSFLKRKTMVSLTGSSQAIGNVVMVNGDVVADSDPSEVGPTDIDAVIANFGNQFPVPGTGDVNADVDADGEVAPVDIDIVISNFGAQDDQ